MKNYIKFCNQNSLKPSTFEALQAYKSKIMKKKSEKETAKDKKIRLIQLKRAKLEQIQLLLHLQKLKGGKKSN